MCIQFCLPVLFIGVGDNFVLTPASWAVRCGAVVMIGRWCLPVLQRLRVNGWRWGTGGRCHRRGFRKSSGSINSSGPDKDWPFWGIHEIFGSVVSINYSRSLGSQASLTPFLKSDDRVPLFSTTCEKFNRWWGLCIPDCVHHTYSFF